MCFNVAPELFALDDDGYNRMAPFTVGSEHERQAQRAVRLCPERAISMEEI